MSRDSIDLLEGIFLVLTELRVAIDRKGIRDTDLGRSWKKKQSDDMFELRWGEVVARLPVLRRNCEERKMRNKWAKTYEKMVTRQNKVLGLFKMVSDCRKCTISGLSYLKFGCIVVLDPIWGPLETSTVDFHQLHTCVLQNVLTRRRRTDELGDGNGDVPWISGNDMANRKMLVELVRYFTTDVIAGFVDRTVQKLEVDAAAVLP